MAVLPDGIIKSAAPYADATGVTLGEPEGSYFSSEGSDLGDMMDENSLAGLGWLNGIQDPDRLPKNPVDRGIMELQEAWGVNRRTNGLIPNQDRRDTSKEASIDDAELERIVRRAQRKAAYGEPLQDVLKDVAHQAAYQAPLLKEAMLELRQEYGLHGKVYIKASSFPGLHNGKWKDVLHQKCAGAKYLLIPETMGDDTAAHIASILNKTPVRQIPWKQALRHYEPLLRSAGRKVASEGSAKEILRAAFASASVGEDSLMDVRPVPTHIADTISLEDARVTLDMTSVKLAKVTKQLEEQAQHRKAMQQQLGSWVRGGLLDKQDALRLAYSGQTPRQIVETAVVLISASGKTAQYLGTGLNANPVKDMSREAAWAALEAAPESPQQRTLQEKKAALEAALAESQQSWSKAKKASEKAALTFIQSTQRDYMGQGKALHFAEAARKDRTNQHQATLDQYAQKVANEQSEQVNTQKRIAKYLGILIQSKQLTDKQARKIAETSGTLKEAQSKADMQVLSNSTHTYSGVGEGSLEATLARSSSSKTAKGQVEVASWVQQKKKALKKQVASLGLDSTRKADSEYADYTDDYGLQFEDTLELQETQAPETLEDIFFEDAEMDF